MLRCGAFISFPHFDGMGRLCVSVPSIRRYLDVPLGRAYDGLGEDKRPPMPKYWRVTIKGGRKAHLTKFTPDFGSESTAICGKMLPEDRRKGSAATINEPIGNECIECLCASGHLKRPKTEISEEERRLQTVVNIANFLHDHLSMTPADIRSVLDDLNKRKLSKKQLH